MRRASILLIIIFSVLILIPGFAQITETQSVETQTIEIADTVSSKKSGVNVTITVYPEDFREKNIEEPQITDFVYFFQTLTDENGVYRFFVTLDFKYSYYTAYVNISGEELTRKYILRAEEHFSENFSYYNDGIPENWVKIGGRNEYFTKAENEKALCINTGGKEGVLAKYFDRGNISSGVLYMSYRFKLDTLGGMLGIRLLTENFTAYNKANEQNMDESIYILSDGSIGCYYGTRGWDSLGKIATYNTSVWHNVECWIDLDRDLITYYLDKSQIFTTKLPNHSYKGICWAYEGSNNPIYLDDIEIQQTDGMKIKSMLLEGISVPEYLQQEIYVHVTALGSEGGNIFFGNEKTEFSAKVTNNNSFSVNKEIRILVSDAEDNIVWEITDTVELDSYATDYYDFTPVIENYGIYSLKITAGDAIEICTFSKCVNNTELNPDTGINVHFNWPTWGYVDKNMTLIKNAGFGITRSGWETQSVNNGERTIFTTDSEFGKYIDRSDIYGIDILAKVDDNGIYRTDNTNIVTSPEGLLEVEAYYKWLAETYGDKVKYVEVRNECDLEIMADKPLYTCEEYAKVLKAVYKGVKNGNPNVKVIAFASAIIREDFFDKMFKQELFDSETGKPYFDIISVHPYHRGTAPEMRQTNHGDGTGYFQNWYDYSNSLYDILEDYGLGDIECWASEIGWSNAETDEISQASYSVRVLLLNDIYKCFDKMLFYNLQDNGITESNVDHNYGLIYCWHDLEKPYGAKPAYLALSNYNNIIGKMEFDSYSADKTFTNTVYKSKYKAGDRECIVVWSVSGNKEISIDLGDVVNYSVYDMYGNKTTHKTNNGICTLIAEGTPKYVEYSPYSAGIYYGDTQIEHLSQNYEQITVRANTNTSDYSGQVVMAGYIGDTLVFAETPEFNSEGVAELTFDNNGSFDKVKIFIFENSATIKPLTEAISVGQEVEQ